MDKQNLKAEYEFETGDVIPEWNQDEYDLIKQSETYPRNNRSEPVIFDKNKFVIADVKRSISNTFSVLKQIHQDKLNKNSRKAGTEN